MGTLTRLVADRARRCGISLTRGARSVQVETAGRRARMAAHTAAVDVDEIDASVVEEAVYRAALDCLVLSRASTGRGPGPPSTCSRTRTCCR